MESLRRRKRTAKSSRPMVRGSAPGPPKASSLWRFRNSRRPKRRGSMKRSSLPLASVSRAWVWASTGASRRIDLAQLANDVLAGAVHGEESAAFEAFCLAAGRSLEGLAVGAEPDGKD